MSSPERTVRVGLIGEESPDVRAHRAIPLAIERAQADEEVRVVLEWLPTRRLASAPDSDLGAFDALWCVPGSPYESMDGALRAIRFARESGTPFLGTCGGFQHAILEIARNVIGLVNADHTESSPAAEAPVIHRLACSLVGAKGRVTFAEGSALRAIYGAPSAVEGYHCNYGLNSAYAPPLASARLRITAVDDAGDARGVELPSHRFFVATLFQPELSAFGGVTHPLVRAFVRAARGDA
jgi:CTP synthase (UTP-ammonia lyase)